MYNNHMVETIIILVALLLAFVGLIGSVLPALPGPPLGYAGMLLLHFGLGDVFSNGLLLVFGGLTIVAVALDFVLPLIGAKVYGASRHGIIGSTVGMLVGLLLFNVIGMFAGMFIGAVTGEYLAGQKTRQALRSGWASFAGSMAAMGMKLALCIAITFEIIVNIF